MLRRALLMWRTWDVASRTFDVAHMGCYVAHCRCGTTGYAKKEKKSAQMLLFRISWGAFSNKG